MAEASTPSLRGSVLDAKDCGDDLIINRFYLVTGTIEKYFPETECGEEGFSMAGGLYCSMGYARPGIGQLMEKLMQSKTKCHVFGPAMLAGIASRRISPIIIQSHAAFTDRWEEPYLHNLHDCFKEYAKHYHEALWQLSQS